LTPCPSYAVCGDRPDALQRRTRRLVADVARLQGVEYGGDYLCRPGRIARRIRFTVLAAQAEPWRLTTSLWPAGTAAQANAFHDALQVGNRRAGFLFLDGYEGWRVEPDLNFSFLGTKLMCVASPCGLAGYLGHFFSDLRPYGRRQRQEWTALVREWEQHGIIGPQDGDRIPEALGARPFLDVNPRFRVYRHWDRDTVIAFEHAQRLAARVSDALATPLAAWGETLRGGS